MKYIKVLEKDKVIKNLIKKYGSIQLTKVQNCDYFRYLTKSIIGQQLSTKAANSIYTRLLDYTNNNPTPQAISSFSLDELKKLGISKRKGSFLKNLSTYTLNNPLKNIDDLQNELVIEQLTKIKGIGVWTAKMFLIFALGRTDITPYEDLALKEQIKILYNLKENQDIKEFLQNQANYWHPFESIACLYIWKDRDST